MIEGLPSAVDATGAVIGAADVARFGGTTYVLVAGGGEGHGNQGVANGIYAVMDDGSAGLVVDLSAWFAAYSVENFPEADFDPEGNFYNMIAGEDDRLWVSESNSEQILAISTSGEIERVADLSAENMVPTGLAPAPDGGVYVGYLSGAPFTDGAAKVIQVTTGRRCLRRLDRPDDGDVDRGRRRWHPLRGGNVDREYGRAAVRPPEFGPDRAPDRTGHQRGDRGRAAVPRVDRLRPGRRPLRLLSWIGRGDDRRDRPDPARR